MSIVRGAYIARLNLLEPHNLGVANKVHSQIDALSSQTVSIDLYFPSGPRIYKNTESVCEFQTTKAWRRLNYYLFFYIYLAKNLNKLSFLYIRYQRSSPLFLWLLKCVRKNNPGILIFVELPSYPYESEQTTVRDKIFGSIDKLSRRFMEKYVSHIVTFSRVPEIFGIKTITIDNGIDIKRLKVLPAAKKEGALQLLGLANLSFWHGYDRVISGIAEYIRNSGSREVTFKIIGTGNELARLQEISRKLGVESYIMFTGGLHGDELNEAMLGCHIGISSIGMHRLNVDTSNLKSREFCARGLPFVIAYNDRDFPPDFPFVFYAPASDEPLDIKALINFYDTLRDNYPDYQEVMRAYSTNRLTWHAKLAPVSDLIQKHLSSVVK